jgi:hypothetical protein
MVDSKVVSRARAVHIAHEIHRRGIRLRRCGHELVGPCPICGGTNRFAVHLVKNTFVCRRCPAGGGAIDLVMHLDGVPFAEAVAILTDGQRRAASERAVGECVGRWITAGREVFRATSRVGRHERRPDDRLKTKRPRRCNGGAFYFPSNRRVESAAESANKCLNSLTRTIP